MKVSGGSSVTTSFIENMRQTDNSQKEVSENKNAEKPIKVNISKEGREHYRRNIEAQKDSIHGLDAVVEQRRILKNANIRMDSSFETRFYDAENSFLLDAKDKELVISAKDIAEKHFDTYVKLYDEIAQGYADGTREVYVSDENSENGYRKLTKEEELAELDIAYGKVSNNLEKKERTSRTAQAIIDENAKKIASIKATGYYKKSEKTEDEKGKTDGIADNISKKMIDATNLFKAQYGKEDLSTLLSKIKVFADKK